MIIRDNCDDNLIVHLSKKKYPVAFYPPDKHTVLSNRELNNFDELKKYYLWLIFILSILAMVLLSDKDQDLAGKIDVELEDKSYFKLEESGDDYMLKSKIPK